MFSRRTVVAGTVIVLGVVTYLAVGVTFASDGRVPSSARRRCLRSNQAPLMDKGPQGRFH